MNHKITIPYILDNSEIHLTTEHATSSYGIPVLVITQNGSPTLSLGPDDILHIGTITFHAGDIVVAWIRHGTTKTEREDAKRYLASSPTNHELCLTKEELA